jgi:ribose transport system substrate-binding protein
MKKSLMFILVTIIAVAMIGTMTLAGCQQAAPETTAAETTAAPETTAAETTAAETTMAEETMEEEDMDAIDPMIEQLRVGMDQYRTENIEFAGPAGQTPTWDTELYLTVGEVAEIQAGGYKAALARHGSQGEYTEALYGGCLDYFEYLNFEITADTSAEFDDAALQANVETIMATEPDVIVGFPQNTITAAEIFQPAVDAGINLVFVSNLPEGYVHPDDFVGISTSQPFDQGVYMARAIGDSGAKKVGVIFFDADFYIVNLIDDVVRDTLAAEYPDVEIIAEQGFADVTQGITDAANALIQQNPEVEALYVSFNALNAATACEDADRPDIKIVSQGLDVPYMVNMLSDGNIYAIITDSTYNIGVNMSIMGGYGVLGKIAPEYVVAPSATITKDNVTEMWDFAFRIVPLPDAISELL